tara:strand:+ start:626 stop:808 length:183 start_codon:yes stop_codon:yes gene_type:complete
MPDKVTVTPASGKIEFTNDDGTEIASLEAKNTSGDSSTDEVELSGTIIKGGIILPKNKQV